MGFAVFIEELVSPFHEPGHGNRVPQVNATSNHVVPFDQLAQVNVETNVHRPAHAGHEGIGGISGGDEHGSTLAPQPVSVISRFSSEVSHTVQF